MSTATATLSSSNPTLGRPRSKHFGLPPRMQRKGRALYYVTGDGRKWIPLGSDLRAARARWAELEGGYTAETVQTLLDRYVALRGDISEGSRRQYRSWAKSLAEEFGAYRVEALQTYHVAEWRDRNTHRQPWVIGCLSLLRMAYERAREWGWCAHDPCPKAPARTKRDRLLSHAEFRVIRTNAVQWLQNAMDLSYLTSLRESDVCGLRWAAVGDSLYIRQVKTGRRQEIETTPELQSVLDRCKEGKIRGLYVIADERGMPITVNRLQRYFRAAVKKAGVEDARFHDIRALAATDAKKAGLDYQALLGHTTRQQSDAYVRSREAVKATPNRKVL